MIRLAEFSELDIICSLAEDFWAHTSFDEPFDRLTVLTMLIKCYENETLLVAIVDNHVVGFCTAVIGPLLANKRVLVATELAWWVDANYRQGSIGVKLFKALETVVKEKGAKYMCMIAMESSMPTQIKSMYERSGYELTESLFMRKL